jgi:hypothetical protein
MKLEADSKVTSKKSKWAPTPEPVQTPPPSFRLDQPPPAPSFRPDQPPPLPTNSRLAGLRGDSSGAYVPPSRRDNSDGAW